jgi:hypothetical protein
MLAFLYPIITRLILYLIIGRRYDRFVLSRSPNPSPKKIIVILSDTGMIYGALHALH